MGITANRRTSLRWSGDGLAHGQGTAMDAGAWADAPGRIVIVCPSWVGDMVMAQSLFKALKRRYPDVRLDALAPPWSLPLLGCMPEIDDAIEMPIEHGELALRKRRRIAARLKQRNYDQAVILPNSFKSALIPYWARIPRRTGWLGELRYGLVNDARRLDRHRLPMTVQRFVALAGDGADCDEMREPPRLELSSERATKIVADLGVEHGDRPVLALCPGAEYGPAKRWSASRFAELARRWIAERGEVWLLGSDKDEHACATVAEAAGAGCVNFAGHTALEQAVALIARSDAVVCNDSGLMHVAAALDRPLVAIYGSSDPGFTPPLSPRSRIVSAGLECSPCFKRTCPLGTYACLRRVTVDGVYEQVEQLMVTTQHVPR